MDGETIREAIKRSNLQYLWGKEGKEFTLTQECKGTTHGADVDQKGTFVSCLLGSMALPAGTKGLLFVADKITYSEYVRHEDWECPKTGADIIKTGAYYTFCTIAALPGSEVEVLVDCFKSVDHEPKVIGKVQ